MRLYEIDPHKPASIVHFDWITVVFPIPPTPTERGGKEVITYITDILNALGFNDLYFDLMPTGIYRYQHSAVAGNNSIIVGYNTHNSQNAYDVLDTWGSSSTFMLQMSGSGVETLEDVLANHNSNIAEFIKTVTNKYQATFSRVDPCCNFFNYPKEYSARYVGEEAEKGNLITRASWVRTVRKFSSKGGKNDLDAYQGASEGFTTYIGKNPKQIRIYNKLAERAEKVNLLYQVDSWSRWEYQLNGKYAQGFIDAYLKRNCDLVQTWIDWLASNYRFIERVGHQARRDRYPNAVWYDDLIKHAKEKIVVRSGKQKPTFARQAKWLKGQVIPTLATIYFARIEKYKKNGVTDREARKLALEKVQHDMEDVALDQRIDWKKVASYVAENEGI